VIVITAFFIAMMVSLTQSANNYRGTDSMMAFFWVFLAVYCVTSVIFVVYKRSRQLAFRRALDQHCRDLTAYWSSRGVQFRFKEEGCGRYVAWFIEVDLLNSTVQPTYAPAPSVGYPHQQVYSAYPQQPQPVVYETPAVAAPPSKEESSSLLSNV
jgi:hypothetical protein